MDKEIIDLIDTAVKIGLGALISGSFTYLGICYSEKSKKQHFILEHKTQLLEKVVINVDDYFSAWSLFVSKIQGIAKHCDRKGIQVSFDKYGDQIQKHDQLLRESWTKADTSLAYLALLDAGETAKALKRCRHLEYTFRTPIMYDKNILPYDELVKKRTEYVDAQNHVLEKLSLFYSSL